MVLSLIVKMDLYGYQIIKHLRVLSGETFVFKEGTLYPILHSLERNQFISSYWLESSVGRKRKYYHITDEGKQELTVRLVAWTKFAGAVTKVLEGEVPDNED